MKYVCVIFFGLLFFQFTSCKKETTEPEEIIYKDGILTDAVWKVEKMTTSDGVVIPNPDVGTVFEEAQIYIEFNADNSIRFSFSGLPGLGSYQISNDNAISIGGNYSVTVEIGFESKYYDLHLESMKSVTHYSIDGSTLQLFYGSENSIIYLKKY